MNQTIPISSCCAQGACGTVTPTPAATTSSPVQRLTSALLLSGVAASSAEIFVWSGSDEHSWYVLLLAVLAIASGGRQTLRQGWHSLRNLNLDIHFLMSLAVLGAMAIGQWTEAAMVIFLFALAAQIESFSLEKAQRAISSLLTLAPEEALLQGPDQQWRMSAVASIQPGAIIRIRPGERIPLDGVVSSGSSTVNQAPITGESQPVSKQTGDSLYAGTINQLGTLECRVTSDRDHTTLARIIATIQEAQAQRAPMQRFIDRFARYYTPAVVGIAILLALVPPLLALQPWPTAIYNALVLLVVACPCALVISTPITIVSGLTVAARHGILIKGGVHLENGYRLQALAIDKTGTLTHGRLQLTDVIPLHPQPEATLLQTAAALESHSEHPLATAILEAWQKQENPLPLPAVSQFQALPGQGISAHIAGEAFFLGTPRWIKHRQIDLAAWTDTIHTLEQQAKTVVILASARQPLAILAASDTLRPEARHALQQLQQSGMQICMLSGDNQRTAQAIAAQCHIREVYAELLPEQKQQQIKQLSQRYACVGMVGDGINDAPALAQAHISFAMGKGTATALETADVALIQEDLGKLPLFLAISRASNRILRQNIALALLLKAAVLLLAMLGHATLWMAVFADVGASLLVIFNGLRLLRLRY
ncbi:MAG: heavy metal translocating P-type ATPase [Magnetococcales bacterium]|nr:heavy metal translocating P-type ATPase [Magnetococcales bacterium]